MNALPGEHPESVVRHLVSQSGGWVVSPVFPQPRKSPKRHLWTPVLPPSRTGVTPEDQDLSQSEDRWSPVLHCLPPLPCGDSYLSDLHPDSNRRPYALSRLGADILHSRSPSSWNVIPPLPLSLVSFGATIPPLPLPLVSERPFLHSLRRALRGRSVEVKIPVCRVTEPQVWDVG